MTLSIEDQIADAVAYELNLGTQAWATLPNTATRAYDTVFQESDLTSLQVVAVPLTLDWSRQSRGGTDRFEFMVTVDLQQKLSAASGITGQVETLNLTAQQMHDWFRAPHYLTTTGAAVTGFECFEAKRPEIFVPERLWHDRVWETYLELTVRAYR
jgi:hypothetical protein